MTREEHRDRIMQAQTVLNNVMADAAYDGYTIVIDTLECSIISGGSYPIVTASTMENV